MKHAKLLRSSRPCGNFISKSYLHDHTATIREIATAENPINNQRIKHIDIPYHFIRQILQEKQIAITVIITKQQLADILTNTRTTIRRHRNSRKRSQSHEH